MNENMWNCFFINVRVATCKIYKKILGDEKYANIL